MTKAVQQHASHETAATQGIKERREQEEKNAENMKKEPENAEATQFNADAAERGAGLTERPRTHGKPAPNRIVNYVLANRDTRPFIIVRVWNEAGNVSGHVFHDGPNDAKIDQHGPYKADVPYDPEKSPETWHWPSLS